MKLTRVTSYETKSKQAEIFRRAAAGEGFLVTNNGKPQVEIRQAITLGKIVSGAVKVLIQLQKRGITKDKCAHVNTDQKALKSLWEEGRD